MFDAPPPSDLDAEMAVLGAAMHDAAGTHLVIELLRPEDYYQAAHATIHKAMAALASAGKPVDLVTVSNLLRSRGLLDGIGGAAYLAELSNAVHTTANIEHHAAIVSAMATRRRLLAAASRLVALAHDEGEVASLLEQAERAVCGIGNGKRAGRSATLGAMLPEIYSDIERRADGDSSAEAMTGLEGLDGILGGLAPSDMILLAARPSMGKTALALTIATNVARSGMPVVVFSLEMSKEQLGKRILASEARINGQMMRKGHLRDGDWERLSSATGRLAALPIWIDDSHDLSARAMRSECRRIQTEAGGIGLIVIDYIGLMEVGDGQRNENRTQEVAKLSKAVKGLAREFNAPVMALSQLNRSVESRPNKRPLLSDLRDSGALEQDADVVMFIYRDDYYNPESNEANIAEVSVAKHRNGSTGMAKLFFDKNLTSFHDQHMEGVPL